MAAGPRRRHAVAAIACAIIDLADGGERLAVPGGTLAGWLAGMAWLLGEDRRRQRLRRSSTIGAGCFLRWSSIHRLLVQPSLAGAGGDYRFHCSAAAAAVFTFIPPRAVPFPYPPNPTRPSRKGSSHSQGSGL